MKLIDKNDGLTELHLKIVLIIILPLFFGCVFMLKGIIFKKGLSIYQLFMNFMISYFVLQQQIFLKLFEILNCEEYKFDNFDIKSFLRNYEGIQCYTSYHNGWIFFIIIPFFLIYGILAPLSSLLLFHLKKKRDE